MQVRSPRRLVAAMSVVAALALVAGCGDSSDDDAGSGGNGGNGGRAVQIDVGTGTPIEVNTSKPHIGMLWTSGNLFLQAFEKGAKDEAERRGVELTVLDSKFDPVRQSQQAQNALQQKQYDGLVVVPLDGNTMCPVLSRQAPSEGIPVVTAVVPMCNRIRNPEGDELWSPGTVAHSGFQVTVDSAVAWYKEVARRMGPGRHTVALLLGPPLIAGTISSLEGLRQVLEANEVPNLDIKYQVNTDYTTPDGLARTQTLLQAHPEIEAILSTYSDITIGAVRAVKAAGREDEVRVFDQGATGQTLAGVRAGDIEFTTAAYPYTYGVNAVKALVDAFEGKESERWYGAYVQGSTLGNPLVIDQDSIDEYRPEY
jgi:ribose transport system substrate-binding protein